MPEPSRAFGECRATVPIYLPIKYPDADQALADAVGHEQSTSLSTGGGWVCIWNARVGDGSVRRREAGGSTSDSEQSGYSSWRRRSLETKWYSSDPGDEGLSVASMEDGIYDDLEGDVSDQAGRRDGTR